MTKAALCFSFGRSPSRGEVTAFAPCLLSLLLLCCALAGAGGCAARTPESDRAAVRDRLTSFNQAWSRYDAEGVGSAFARSTPEERELSDAFAQLVRSSRELHAAQDAAWNEAIPWPLRRYVTRPKTSLLDLASRWMPYAQAAGEITTMTAEADGTMRVATSDARVEFVMRPEKGGRRWVIDPATFSRVGDARTVAAAVRDDVPLNKKLVAAFETRDPAKIGEAFTAFAAARAAGLLRAIPESSLDEVLGGAGATPAAGRRDVPP